MRSIRILAATSTALYAGGCLAVIFIDVPYVKTLPSPEAAQKTFAVLLRKMGPLMAPQLLLTVILTLVASIDVARHVNGRRKLQAYVPFLLSVGLLVETALVHIPINSLILGDSLSSRDFVFALEQWEVWHVARTVVATFAAAIAIANFPPLLDSRKKFCNPLTEE